MTRRQMIFIYGLILIVLVAIIRNIVLPNMNLGLIDGTQPISEVVENKTSPEKITIQKKEIILLLLDEFKTGHAYTSATGDFNKDGYEDFVIGNYNQQNYLYLNNGDNTFSQTPLFGKGLTESVVAADFNNDGWLDLAVGNYNQDDSIFINNKDNTFTELPVLGKGTTKVLIADDFDNNGFIDVMKGTEEHGTFVYRNIDGSHFEERQISSLKLHIRAISSCKLNGNLPDVILGTDFDQNYLVKNEGDFEFSLIPMFGKKMHTTSITCADMDKDSKNDVIVVGKSQKESDLTTNYIYKNLGNYEFKPIAQDKMFSTSVLATDFNKDGYQDLFIGNYKSNSYIYENLGKMVFKKIPLLGENYLHSTSSLDIDGDGFSDLLITNDVQDSKLYISG